MRVLVFGATGLAGSAALRVCLRDPAITHVTAVVRRPVPQSDPKLRVILCQDFTTLAGAEDAFDDVDACLFCLGVSVSDVDGEATYRKVTFDTALAAARLLMAKSPQATFHFLSGRSTNAQSRMMWSRVKGETELALQQLGLHGVMCWRPGGIVGDKPAASKVGAARVVWSMLLPVMRALRPIKSMTIWDFELGQAMLQASFEGLRSGTVENDVVRDFASRYQARNPQALVS
jgi:uncharacterized protein YbjT (DUF2867 family)